MRWRAIVLLVASTWCASCDRRETPQAPGGDPPAGQVQASPGDRLGWNQRAADAIELASFRYALYVDGARTSVNASCSPTADASVFACSVVLPSMTAGTHTIEIAAFVMDGSTVLESSRSAPLHIFFSGVPATGASASSLQPTTITTAEQVRLQLTPLVEGLEQVADLAFAPDGSILIAERSGIVRSFSDGQVLATPALDLTGDVQTHGQLLSLTLDPAFSDNGLMYVLYASAAGGESEFTLARFRGVMNTFAERAVLLDRVAAPISDAGGAMRVGPDGKLYVGLDGMGDASAAGNLASYNGKVLRLNVDATTPDDQAHFTPVFSVDHPQPVSIDWQPSTGHAWVLDRMSGKGGRLSAIAPGGLRDRRGSHLITYALPAEAGATSAAFYRHERMPMFKGNLFVAAHGAGELIRLRFDPANPSRIVSTERLLSGLPDGVRTVAAAPDGALYVASETRVYRLAP